MMKIFSFYSSWYDKHTNAKKLEKAGIDPWNFEGGGIPEHLRSPHMDFIVSGIPEGEVFHFNMLHIYHNGRSSNDHGDNWRMIFYNGQEEDILKSMSIVPSQYHDTLREVKSLPDLPNRIWFIIFSAIFLGNDWDSYDQLKDILRKNDMDHIERLDKD